MGISKMDYRDILGIPRKPKKKVEKRVVKQPSKPSITDNIKKELNEWSYKPPTQKRWSGAYAPTDSGLTEFEETGGKDNVNEGPAYEYSKFIKKIEKSRDSFGKDVLNFYELLRKKGLDDEAHDLLDDYKKYVIKFGLKFKKFVRTLL